MIKICYGCGVKLQCENSAGAGYIPENKVDNASYCQRCFKMMHYGVLSSSDTPKEINTIINAINKDNKFVIFLMDFLMMNLETIKIFKKIKKDKLLVLSKADIIPKNMKEEKIKSYLKENYQINDDIRLISSFSFPKVEALIKYLFKRNITSVYIVGLSNSGKSTLINKIIEVSGSKMQKITTNYTPNTTLDFIRIKINDNLTIIDSPGFIVPSINDDVILKKNNIKVSIKPTTFQMKAGESLSIENFFLNFSENTSITLYMSNEFKTNKYFKDVEFDNEILVQDNTDLLITGLGFINVKNKCMIKTNNIKSELISVRDSIFGSDKDE